jgi:hypothetical protein
MLVHKQVLRRKFQRLAVTTVIVGLTFLTSVGIAVGTWLTQQGAEHAEIIQTVAMYSNLVVTESEVVIPDKYTTLSTEDPRNTEKFVKKVAAVKKFLNSYGAPLAANAEDFVRAAEMYGIDYRLLPAISMIESTGGKHLFRPYNPFGWGRWGYPSFTVAIYDVARGMSNYYAGGLREPEKIAYRYNPVTPKDWGRKARAFMNQMPAL